MIQENHVPTEPEERPLKPALRRGWGLCCPACGGAPLMEGYLSVRPRCPACGTELHHHRADDGPAWATILLAGHIMAPIMLIVFELWHPPGWVMALGFSTVFLMLALYLLPRLKGAFVGFQWAKRMHGFGLGRDLAPGR